MTFRPWEIDPLHLSPPSVKDYVPPEHLVHILRDLVREELDLSTIFAKYTESRGQPPYHPARMTALLLYAYSRGVYSSRRIERACEERCSGRSRRRGASASSYGEASRTSAASGR